MAVVQLDTEERQPENGFVSPETTSSSPGVLTRVDQDVLPFLGGFGKYQRQLIALTWIPALFIGFSQYSDNFLLAQPNNTCVRPLANASEWPAAPSSLLDGARNMSAPPLLPAHVHANRSHRGGHNDSSRLQCACSEWTFELHTGLVRNVVTKWSLVCDSAWKVHIAKFSLLVGSIFGYLVFGILADWFGRHPVLIISVLFMLVFGLTVAFSVNVPMFSTLRFFEGFCLAGIILSLYVLRIELCLPAWRFSMTMVASFVVLAGQLLMPGVAYLCGDWQVLQAVIICPLVLMLSYIWIFPESLRWLLATQQYGRSQWIMGRIAEKNQVNVEQEADNIFTELQGALQKKPKKTCIVKMVRTRNLWKNIVVLCVNSLTGYGIHHCFARSMVDPEAEEITMFHNFYADYFTMAGIAVASCMALCPAVGLMGRRGGLLMFMIITALASLLQLGLLNLLGKYSNHLNIDTSGSLNQNFSVAFSIIGMFSSHAVSNLSIFFCAEITPTVIRGGGVGLVLASAGFGMLTAPIMELHNQKGYFLHHIIFACCTLICIICILLLPETRFQPLPETLADGERYTRQPLLHPRKPGEQRLLLPQSDSSRDYTRVHDTPLHEAATTAVSTMDSTASSAVDLTGPAGGEALALTELRLDKAEPKDANGRSAPPSAAEPVADLGKGDLVHSSKERLLSSTPLHKAPQATDPLLADPEEPTAQDVDRRPDHSEILEMGARTPPRPLSVGAAPPEGAATPLQAVPASSLISTTPIIEPRPSSTLDSPEPLEDQVAAITLEVEEVEEEEEEEEGEGEGKEGEEDAPAPSAETPPPPARDHLPPSPTPSAEAPPSLGGSCDLPVQVESEEESSPAPPPRDPPAPPDLDSRPPSDSPPPCVNDEPPRSLTPPTPGAASPPSAAPPRADSASPTAAAPFNPPAAAATTVILPVTEIVPAAAPEPAAAAAAAAAATDPVDAEQDSALATDSIPPLIDCTASAPIDSGVLPVRDGASTENNTLNGVPSS
ncbi:solute carrier family 22 member 23-like [Nelusetta ayraudi]|uniref:solute carrier family 22 member 23-like n=1 Tax=Nelusetta ayraudi TaxID=303726 RepID=UPI003F703CF7